LERSKNESTLLVLDTTVACDPTSSERHRQISALPKGIADTPLQMESKVIFDPSCMETTCSLAWVPGTLHIATGLNSKTIKIYDLKGKCFGVLVRYIVVFAQMI